MLPSQVTVQALLLADTVQLPQLLIGHVQQLARVHATISERAEGPFLLLHFGHLGGCLEKEALAVSAYGYL